MAEPRQREEKRPDERQERDSGTQPAEERGQRQGTGEQIASGGQKPRPGKVPGAPQPPS